MRKLLLLTIIMLFHTTSSASIQPGINDHVAGDIIALRTDMEIAAWCNFDKSIVVTSANVLCVYNGNKRPATY
jgi:hypothetical protein